MKKRIKLALGLIALLLTGFMVPERTVIPVHGGDGNDWNHETFWYEPWGRSGVHKGIDIFAATGTPLLAATDGIVVFRGELALGGKVVAVLGPKWRVHYFAHLNAASTSPGSLVAAGEPIGKVGATGNAKNKPPHLHYAVVTLVPYPWRWDSSTQGWKKMFFLDPGQILLDR